MPALQLLVPLLATMAAPELAPELVLTGERAEGRWVEVTPVSPGSPGRVFDVPDGAGSLRLEGAPGGAVMLCVGGREAATWCERAFLEPGGRVTAHGPAAGTRLTAKVRIGRAPAAGALVGVLPEPLAMRRPFGVPILREQGRFVKRISCNQEGRLSLLLAPGRYRLDITTDGGRNEQSEPFTVPDPRSVRPRQPPSPTPPTLDLGDVVLEEGLRVEVGVTDSAGLPIGAATVGAIQETPGGRLLHFETVADAQGRAVLTRVDARLPVNVVCAAPGYLRREQSFDVVPNAMPCLLLRTSTIQGRVLDSEESPLAGALVSIPGRSTSTRSDGSFQFESLSPGAYSLAVAAPGFRAVERTASIAAEEQLNLPPVSLEPAEDLVGVVREGSRGDPIEGATVTVRHPPGGGAATTDEEGRFHLRTGADLPVKLEISAAGFPATFAEPPAEVFGSGEPFVIDLFPGGRIQVAVWNEEEDSPCSGCAVNVTMPGGQSQSLITAGNGEALSPLLARGQYYVALERVESLGPVVRVSGGDDLRWATVEPGKTVRVEIGERMSRLAVLFTPSPSPEVTLLVEGLSQQSRISASADGSFLVRRRDGEALALSLQLPSGDWVRQVVIPGDLTESFVRLPLPQTRLAGRLLRDDLPVPSQVLLLVSEKDGAVSARFRTDGQGAFSISHLPPGPYRLLVDDRIVLRFHMASDLPADLGTVAIPSG